MSRGVEIWQVDAFTAQPFCGNPAGVVLDASGLSDAEMQKIAAEMNVARCKRRGRGLLGAAGADR